MSAYLSLIGRRRGGRLFEAGRLLTFSAFRMGAYSRWALIRGWALIRINTVLCGRKNLFWSAGGALKNPFGFRACTHFEQRKSNETYLNEPSRRREILNIQLFRERLSEKMCT